MARVARSCVLLFLLSVVDAFRAPAGFLPMAQGRKTIKSQVVLVGFRFALCELAPSFSLHALTRKRWFTADAFPSSATNCGHRGAAA
eukprot:2582466-Rhodomonas_salina.1